MIDMYPPISLSESAKIFALGLTVMVLAFGTLLRDARRVRALQALALSVVTLLTAGHLAWAYGIWVDRWPIVHRAGNWTTLLLIPFVFVAWSLPLAGLVWQLLRGRAPVRRALVAAGAQATPACARKPEVPVAEPRPVAEDAPPAPRVMLTRRRFANAMAVSVPLVTFGASVKGYRDGLAPPLTRRIDMPFVDLAPELDGLTILQVSDVHLGLGRRLSDLESFFDQLRAAPDLIVLTGDVADDLSMLDGALRIVKNAAPRLGVYSVLGNHEHFHGAKRAAAIHRAARVPLLFEEGGTISVGRSRLYLAGVNDPIHLQANIDGIMQGRVAAAMKAAPGDAFSVLLSHRPEGFVPGAPSLLDAQGANLTLSGHTHGGQIGFNGKSAFETLWPERYLWGSFEKDGRRLYTTSGFGHWFPFRLGCPTEVPVLTLRGADSSVLRAPA